MLLLLMDSVGDFGNKAGQVEAKQIRLVTHRQEKKSNKKTKQCAASVRCTTTELFFQFVWYIDTKFTKFDQKWACQLAEKFAENIFPILLLPIYSKTFANYLFFSAFKSPSASRNQGF